jgi:hypothetical protein
MRRRERVKAVEIVEQGQLYLATQIPGNAQEPIGLQPEIIG